MTDFNGKSRSELMQIRADIERRRNDLALSVRGKDGLLPEVMKAKKEVVRLQHVADTLHARIAAMEAGEDKSIGRKYAYLCRAIKHELGEATLASLIAEADRLSEADAAAAAVEGYA